MIVNAELLGSSTVTESEAVPLSATVKLFDSGVPPLERFISPNLRLDGFTFSSLNGALVLASGLASCAYAVAIAIRRKVNPTTATTAPKAARVWSALCFNGLPPRDFDPARRSVRRTCSLALPDTLIFDINIVGL